MPANGQPRKGPAVQLHGLLRFGFVALASGADATGVDVLPSRRGAECQPTCSTHAPNPTTTPAKPPTNTARPASKGTEPALPSLLIAANAPRARVKATHALQMRTSDPCHWNTVAAKPPPRVGDRHRRGCVA